MDPTPDDDPKAAADLPTAVIALIDFDNVYPDASLDGDTTWLTHEVNRVVSAALRVVPAARFVTVRFYGGWMEGGILSPDGSRLQQAIAVANAFPIARRDIPAIINGDLTLVTRLLDLPGIEWTSTFKRQRGLPRLRLVQSPFPAGCANPSEMCPIHILRAISKKRTTVCRAVGCTVTNENAFHCMGQKMVDTLLACDLLSSCRDSYYGGVLIFSDDSDFLPALALAASAPVAPITVFARDASALLTEVIRTIPSISLETW